MNTQTFWFLVFESDKKRFWVVPQTALREGDKLLGRYSCERLVRQCLNVNLSHSESAMFLCQKGEPLPPPNIGWRMCSLLHVTGDFRATFERLQLCCKFVAADTNSYLGPWTSQTTGEDLDFVEIQRFKTIVEIIRTCFGGRRVTLCFHKRDCPSSPESERELVFPDEILSGNMW